MESQAIIDKLLAMCVACGYQAYKNTLVGNQAPAVRQYYRRITSPRPGDMVLEITKRSAPPMDRIGRLISVGIQEPPPREVSKGNCKEWARSLPHPPYLTVVWRIQTLDGREFNWWNADFIMIPEAQ